MIQYLVNGKGLEYSENFSEGCWIHAENPTLSERNYLIDQLGIPESFYSDIEDPDERPRMEFEEGWFLFVIQIPVKSEDVSLSFKTTPLGIIFNSTIFVSICFSVTDMIPDMIHYSKRKNIIREDNFNFLLRFFLSSSVWYLKYLKQINYNIKNAEQELEHSIRNEDLQTLLRIEKCLVYFTTSLKGNDILVHRLKHIKSLNATIEEELMEDVQIEMRQAQETTRIYSDILSGMMDAYASVISNNLNVIMKRLTSISIILMIPTLIASFYGMNVKNSLEESNFGFWIILMISFGMSALVIFFFRQKKWF